MSKIKLSVNDLSAMIADLHPTLSLADQGTMLANTIVAIDTDIKAKAAPKAPKATVKAKATPKAATSATALNWNGRMMLADDGTITPGQLKNILGIAERNGEPFTAKEIADIKAYSMVTASNFYQGLKEDFAA